MYASRFIFIVAVLNLSLGFGIAVYLGRRYRELVNPDEWSAADFGVASPGQDAPSFARELAVAAETTAEPNVDIEPNDTEPPDIEPTEAPAETDPAEDVSPDSHREKSETETVIEQFQGEVKQYHDRLEEADEKLRSSEDLSDTELVEACTAFLQEATTKFLDSREKAHGGYVETCAERPELAAVNDNVQAAIDRQDEQIETATAVFEAFDPEKDPNSSRQEALSETAKLIGGNHQLRDSLDAALVSAIRDERQMEEIDDGRSRDPLTGLCNRTGLEAYLSDWWKKDPHHARKVTVALLDIDRFSKINEQYGPKVGDRILNAIAQLLEAERDDGGKVARLSGDRFVFLAPDSDVRSTTDIAERIRQTVETADFRYREEDIQMTLSGAVAETMPQDTTDVLIGRAEMTLQEAKRYGRNRTFIYEGEKPTPVVPPNFSLEEKTIDL